MIRPRWTSEIALKYNQLKDDIDARDIRTTPLEERDDEYDQVNDYLTFQFV
jgi:hypothetical protein